MAGNDKNIDFYPYVLSRVGTLPYHLLESIQWKCDDFITIYTRIQDDWQKAENDKGLNTSARSALQQKIKAFEVSFEQAFLQEQQLHRAAFIALAGNEILQKGLLQSSPTFWESVQRYRAQPLHIYRKKERQTERALAQYLARICTKTSPFSTFTALSLNNLSGKNVVENNNGFTSVVRVNNYVLAQLEELLSAYPPFYHQLEVQLNPTLQKANEHYVFLLNSRNIESVQRIEQNEVTELILDIFNQYHTELISFSEIVSKLLERVDAEKSQLESYLADLLRFGLLSWAWPVSGTNPFWTKDFINWLEKRPSFNGKELLTSTLQQLLETSRQIPKLSAIQRWPLIRGAMKSLTKCFREFSKDIPEPKSNQINAFAAFQQSELFLSPERLFFEDTHFPVEITSSEKELKNTIKELDTLTSLFLPLRIDILQQKVLYFFKYRYNNNMTVPLMDFYEAYYKWEKAGIEEESLPEVAAILRQREFFAKKLYKHITINSNFSVPLSLPVLNGIMASVPIQRADVPSPKSFGALLLLHQSEDGQYKSYIDAVFTGYGKMLGRFLHLFPKKYSQHLTARVRDMSRDSLWVTNADASFHNANAHPRFLKKVIATPGGQQYNYKSDTSTNSSSTEENNIALTSLSIRLSHSDNRLILLYKGKEVTIFNYGLEALPSRSPMYRLLATFSTTQPDLSCLKHILTKVTRQQKDKWISLPRVTIGEKLILQRKAWYIPVSDLPTRQKSESEAAYFLRLNHWRISKDLPPSVFISINAPEVQNNIPHSNNTNTDHYKPQYIDFRTPSLVSHFARELLKVSQMLKIEEVLPGKGELLKVNGKEGIAEFVVQWGSWG